MRRFLEEQQLPPAINWMVREDFYFAAATVVVGPRPPETDTHVRKLYERGRASGAIELTAVAASHDETFATLWYPRDAAAGDAGETKMTILDPLPDVLLIRTRPGWAICRLLPAWREFQKRDDFAAARSWLE